jgi:hypothetical protein
MSTPYIIGDRTSWYEEVGRVHASREWRAMRDIRLEEVRSHIAAYIAVSKIAGRRELMRSLQAAVESDDAALSQAIRLLGHRPSHGLFADIQAILDRHNARGDNP